MPAFVFDQTGAEPDWTGFWPGVVRGVDAAKTARPAPAARRAWRPQWALGGALAAALLVSIGVWQFGPDGTQPDGVIVRSASTGDPAATVMVYGTPERDVAVVWDLPVTVVGEFAEGPPAVSMKFGDRLKKLRAKSHEHFKDPGNRRQDPGAEA